MALFQVSGLSENILKNSDEISNSFFNDDSDSSCFPKQYEGTEFKQLEHGLQSGDTKIEFAHGTTTLAFKFSGGIIVAVDSRASMGSYIASPGIKKVIEISPYLLGTMAGGGADCEFWLRVVGKHCRLHELRHRERMSVAAASKLLANMVSQYRGRGLSMGTMIAGFDKMGAALFYVDDEGTRLQGDKFSCGSGSTYAYGVLDNYYRFEMTDEQAHDLAQRAIYHATHRDAASGGVVNLYHVTAAGWRFVSQTDVAVLHDKYIDNKIAL